MFYSGSHVDEVQSSGELGIGNKVRSTSLIRELIYSLTYSSAMSDR